MQDLPKDDMDHIDNMAKEIWEGSAAVIVGAGFSKNAEPIVENPRPFPDWSEFLKPLYRKMNVDPVTGSKNIAGVYETNIGRDELSDYIRNEIPDDEYKPGVVHQKLCALPWSDIYTTNWDTLLERKGFFNSNDNYEVITNTEQIIDSKSPRIIKLNGCLKENHNFIITEDDFKHYDSKNELFSMHLKNTLIEKKLCLFGFSGEDRNYEKLEWWFNTKISGNKEKIFQFDFIDKSNAEKQYLLKRNVIYINLCSVFDGSSPKSLLITLLDCFEQKKPEANKDWPDE